MKSKVALFVSSIGPGLFLVGYNIGTGSVTTMASAGASHGMMLAWAVLTACVLTYFLLVAFGRYTIITGKTALRSYREHFGVPVSAFVLGTIIFTEMISSVGVMAIVTEVIREWSRPLTASGDGWNTVLIALVLIPIMVFVVIRGHYRSLEKVLALFVGLMGVCFFLTAFMVIPDPAAVMRGLVPSIPSEAGGPLIVAGMLGTTMGGVVYVVRSVTVKQKQWSVSELHIEKRDAVVSSVMMFVLSAAVMACAAGTLYPLGLHVDNAIDMLRLLEPLAGRFALSIFVVGIVCAGLSSLFPHYMLVPMLLSDYLQEPLDLGTTRNRAIVVFYALLGLVVPVFGGRPVLVMIASQAFTLTVTPLVILLLMLIAGRPGVMGDRSFGWGMNTVLGVAFLFSVVMSVIGAYALADLF